MQHVGPTQGLRTSTRLVKTSYAEDVGVYRIFRFVYIHTWLKKTLLSWGVDHGVEPEKRTPLSSPNDQNVCEERALQAIYEAGIQGPHDE